MASSSRRQSRESDDSDSNGTLWNGAATLAEIQKQQLAAGAEALSVFYQACETLQQAQVQMGQRAALLHKQAADNLRKATTPMELVTIQSTLAVYEVQEGMRFWQELVAASARAGGEMMRMSRTQEAASETAASMMGGAAPMADAFQQMFTAPLKAAQTHH